MLNTNNIQ